MIFYQLLDVWPFHWQQTDKVPPDMPGEGATKKPWPPKPFQHNLVEAGPPPQQTRQMEKDLEKMLLKGTRKLRP